MLPNEMVTKSDLKSIIYDRRLSFKGLTTNFTIFIYEA